MVDDLARVSAAAVVPDQILPYVAAVSGLETCLIGNCALHSGAGQGVLVAYPLHDPLDAAGAEEAVKLACKLPGLERITVLAANRPLCAPSHAVTSTDSYWQIQLPPRKMPAKLANMLRRARSEIAIDNGSGKGSWTRAHARLVAEFCRRKQDYLDAGTVYLFQQLGAYLDGNPDARLFSAWRRDGSLAGLAIGDYTSLATAFYMFAFRHDNAPPGTSDLLLEAVIREGANLGHSRVNLGLGINPGIEFFKKKWGATSFLAYTETSWNIPKAMRPEKKSWFRRLFGS